MTTADRYNGRPYNVGFKLVPTDEVQRCRGCYYESKDDECVNVRDIDCYDYDTGTECILVKI